MTRHLSDEHIDIDLGEIRMALGQLKNKASGEDGVPIELIKVAGTILLKELAKLFNSVLHTSTITERGGPVFQKEGRDPSENLPSQLAPKSYAYKPFPRIITNQLQYRRPQTYLEANYSEGRRI